MFEAELDGLSISELESKLKTLHTSYSVRRDGRVVFDSDGIRLYETGRRTITIKYEKKTIAVPEEKQLPLFESLQTNNELRLEEVGKVDISKVGVKLYRELWHRDALLSGLSSMDTLLAELAKQYGEIKGGEVISLWYFKQSEGDLKPPASELVPHLLERPAAAILA